MKDLSDLSAGLQNLTPHLVLKKNTNLISKVKPKSRDQVRGVQFCSCSLHSQTKLAGFTIIELIVAIFIFSVLMVLAGGSFVSTLSLQRRALNIKKVEENGRFILELMAREIRVANPISTVDNSCPTSMTSVLAFTHPVNGSIQYSLSGSQVHRMVGGVDSIISNPDVEVSRLTFCISGNTTGDDRQPRVTIILGLKSVGQAAETATIDLQTTVSQRVLSD